MNYIIFCENTEERKLISKPTHKYATVAISYANSEWMEGILTYNLVIITNGNYVIFASSFAHCSSKKELKLL